MARTLEELDAAVGSLEDRIGALEINMGVANTNVGAVQTKLTNLTFRVTQIDGQGSAVPDESNLVQMSKLVAGLKETVEQVTLVLQADMDQIKEQMSALQGLLNQHLGVV